MIVKIINGNVNSWTYYEAQEVTIRRTIFKDLGKFEYSWHGPTVDEEHPVLQITLCQNGIFKYAVIPAKGKAPAFLMGNDGKTLDKIN